MTELKTRPTSEILQGVMNGQQSDLVTLQELKSSLHEKGFALLLVVFSFPMAIPLPYPPGFTTVLGIPLMLFSIQMMLAFDSPWLPKSLGAKTIKRTTLAMMIEKSAPYFQKIEVFTRPRLRFFSSVTGERIVGFMAFLCAISITLPIILGNAVPSLGILIMGFGLLNKDGVVIIGGIITSIIGLFIATAVVIFGIEAIMLLFNNITNALF